MRRPPNSWRLLAQQVKVALAHVGRRRCGQRSVGKDVLGVWKRLADPVEQPLPISQVLGQGANAGCTAQPSDVKACCRECVLTTESTATAHCLTRRSVIRVQL